MAAAQTESNNQVPPSPASPSQPRPSSLAAQVAEERKANEQRAAALAAERQRMLSEARTKAAALYREANDVAAPGEVAAPREQMTMPPPPIVPPAGVVDGAALAAAQLRQAEEIRRAADAKAAQAEARVAAAEAERRRLQNLAANNPYAWLQEQKISPDQFAARLQNGGEPTPEELTRRYVDERTSAAEQRAQAAEEQVRRLQHDMAREKAVAELTPALTQHFPFVSANYTPTQALDALTQAARETGAAPDAERFFSALEQRLVEQRRRELQSPAVAAKLGLDVARQPNGPTAGAPTTLSNRVVSTAGGAPQRPKTWEQLKAEGRAAATRASGGRT